MNKILEVIDAVKAARETTKELMSINCIVITNTHADIMVKSIRDLDQIPGPMELNSCRAWKEFGGVTFSYLHAGEGTGEEISEAVNQ